MDLRVVFNKANQNKIKLTLSDVDNRNGYRITESEEVLKKCKEFFKWVDIVKTTFYSFTFHADVKLYAIQTISSMMLHATSTLVEFHSNRSVTNQITTILGRVLGLRPLLRHVS